MTERNFSPAISPMGQSADRPANRAVSAGRDDSGALSGSLAPTPLAAWLSQTAPGPELQAYHGVLTPRELSAPEKESAALLTGAAVHDLGWLRRVEVRGEDRFRWLHGMVTNTVKGLGTNAGAWNFILDAKGRIQGDLYVWREGERLAVEIAASQYEKLLACLDRFIIMDDVELTPRSLDASGSPAGEMALGLSGPMAANLLAQLALPAPAQMLTSARAAWNGVEVQVVRAYGTLTPHYQLWITAAQIPALWKALTEAGATAVGAASLEALRIAEAIPVYGVDIAERDLPQETSQMRALSFNKGCYLGQELVERVRSRGNVQRHLRALEVSGPLPAAGTELIRTDGAVAGQITSAATMLWPASGADKPLLLKNRSFALGMIHGEAERDQAFTYTAGTAAGTARILASPPAWGTGPSSQPR